MGHRAIAIFYMDDIHRLRDDPEIGRAIELAALQVNSRNSKVPIVSNGHHVGSMVLVEHADMETLMHFSSYDANVAARTCWHQGATDDEIKTELVEQFKK